MGILQIENLSFSYPDAAFPALDSVSFEAKSGEFILICGASGCGKTTLLRSLKKELLPVGEKKGSVLIEGKEVEGFSPFESAKKIGYVPQDPEKGIVTDQVWHEMAFGLENLAVPENEIRRRCAEIASFFGIQTLYHQSTDSLSGGQKQILNLASALVTDPDILLLDEPTANLDPIAANDFLALLKRVHTELGITILLTEHRTEEVFPLADRVIGLEKGRIIADSSPKKLAGDPGIKNSLSFYESLPTPLRFFAETEGKGEAPLSVQEGNSFLKKRYPFFDMPAENPEEKKKTPILSFRDVYFRYEKNENDVLKATCFSLYQGEIFCLLGGNGAGKSTLLSVAAGLKKPYRGKITAGVGNGKKKDLASLSIGYLPQNADSLFLKDQVKTDFDFYLSCRGMKEAERKQRIEATAKEFDFYDLLDRHTSDLSGGEKERCALGKLFLIPPEILLLDEPTQGMDAHFKTKFGSLLLKAKEKGAAVMMVSHDIEFAARFADRCALFFDGTVISAEETRLFFRSNRFYTTAAHRMAKNVFPSAITLSDLLECAKSAGEKK